MNDKTKKLAQKLLKISDREIKSARKHGALYVMDAESNKAAIEQAIERGQEEFIVTIAKSYGLI